MNRLIAHLTLAKSWYQGTTDSLHTEVMTTLRNDWIREWLPAQ